MKHLAPKKRSENDIQWSAAIHTPSMNEEGVDVHLTEHTHMPDVKGSLFKGSY